ncbi:solute carrier family 23 protein [Streptomyces sp. G5(2025)]|uniref:solute carrier family 23 protein n=1 Tax=Streptomyces sp. G5(2025) TaxID=3406628 RepID=UPI003C1B750E
MRVPAPSGRDPGPAVAASGDARGAVDRYFSLTARGSTWRREVLAGASTFMALSYIVVVNPAVLAQGGIPRSAAFVATAVIGGLATVAMGLWARLPFAVAPGMEMNTIVAVSVVGLLGYTWPQALGMVFWSGVAMLVVSAMRLRQAVIDAIPAEAKPALTAAVGVFIGLVGLQIAGVLRSSDGHLSGFGDLASPHAWAAYLGLGTALLVDRLGGRSVAALAGIAVAALHLTVQGEAEGPGRFDPGDGLAALFRFDLGVITDARAWSVILVLFALDFFGSIAKVVGLSNRTPLQDGEGGVPGMRQALFTDAGATVAGSAAGSSSFVVFVESAVGIRAGARTGIAAVVTGVLLLTCLVLGPVLTYIPVTATTGTLLFVAVKMVTGSRPREERGLHWAVTGTAVAATVATLAIDQAMAAAFLVCLVADVTARRRPHPVLLVTTALLTGSIIVQYLSPA